jgi:hypothetical protein
MGSHIDALKLSSSLTLFAAAAERLGLHDFSTMANEVLDAIEPRFPRCPITLGRLHSPVCGALGVHLAIPFFVGSLDTPRHPMT